MVESGILVCSNFTFALIAGLLVPRCSETSSYFACNFGKVSSWNYGGLLRFQKTVQTISGEDDGLTALSGPNPVGAVWFLCPLMLF